MKGTIFMKKTIALAAFIALASTLSCYAADTAKNEAPLKPDVEKTAPAPDFKGPRHHHRGPSPEVMQKKKAEFENRLKLTDEQKQEAKELRIKSHEQMKPIIEEIKAKRGEIKTIKEQSLTQSEKEQIQALKNEIRELDKQIRYLRIKNMKDFESILTEKQQKELKKMKEEGRKNFEKRHKELKKDKPLPSQKPAETADKE